MPRERKKKAPVLLEDGTEAPPKPAKKRRSTAASRAAAANASAAVAGGNHMHQNGDPNAMVGPPGHQMYVPQPHGGYGDTLYASNPFDDAPQQQMMPPGGPPGMPQHGMPPNMGGPMGHCGMPPGHPHGPPPPGMMGPMMGGPGNGMMMPHGGPGGPPPPGMMGPDGVMMGGPRGPHPPGPPGLHGPPRMNGPPPPRMVGPMGGPPPGHPSAGPPPNSMMPGRTYPPDQQMVFNPNNPNAPPIYPCGICHKEVTESDQGILCESGCNFWFHRACTGISERAFQLLKHEVYAEWVCDNCLQNKQIPLIKFKP